MRPYYQNTCIGCDLLHNKVCPHYPKNQYPGHYRNASSSSSHNKPRLYTHQYVELRNGIYEGTMSNFKREGVGIFYSDEGFICIGNWLQDYLEGKSIIFFCNGGYLFVDFSYNKINGLGVLKMKNGSLIAGLWKNNNLEGTAFHHYPDKCLWIECEYRDGQLVRYVREERYGPDLETLEYMHEDKFPDVRLPRMLNVHPNLKALVLSVFTNRFIENIIKEMKLNVRKNENPDGLGVLYDDQYNVYTCGNFKSGYLDGIGRINYDNGDIYEGLIRKKEFQVGIYYTCETNTFEFGNFQHNKCLKIFQSGLGFPFELLKKFKSILHKKHIKFCDKRFDLTNSLNFVANDEMTPTQDEVSVFNEKLKKIELSPASFLQEERFLRGNQTDHEKELNLMLSPIPKKNDSKGRYENFLESSNKPQKTLPVYQNADMYPLNISQHPIREERFDKNFDDFYDKNVKKFTVSSQNNEINDPMSKFSKTQIYVNKETVNLAKPAKKCYNPKEIYSGTFIYEEQNPNKNKSPESPQKNQKSEEDTRMGPHKRSLSFAPPLKKDKEVQDDLREIFESAYMISLESVKEFQSIPKFAELCKNCNSPTKAPKRNNNNNNSINSAPENRYPHYNNYNSPPEDRNPHYHNNNNNSPPENRNHHYPVYKVKKENPICKSQEFQNTTVEKRNYLIYSVNDINHLKNKKEHLIDCLIYDFDSSGKERDGDCGKKQHKKKIFDPM